MTSSRTSASRLNSSRTSGGKVILKPGKDLYDSLPVWAQTVSVNLASARNFRAKYGGVFRGWLEDLARNERKSRDEMLQQQQVAVRHLLEYAVEHVPAYKGRSPETLNEW